MPENLPSLGRYNLETHLGSGAFADVYRAMDTLLDRVVALKVLKPSLVADQQAFKRFLQEAKTAANLLHDHIAWVWDLGEAHGRYFIAMRYVDGPSLAKVIADRGPLPRDEAYARFSELAKALSFAHEKGLVHRDLKPQNILISPTEGAILTDFGLVKAMQTSGLSTHTGALIGTPQYIAPEVWQGQEATPATDQYALACVFVEMLTGITLFDAPTPPAVMMKHFMPLTLPDSWERIVPAGYENIFRKALSQEVNERHESIKAFYDAIENVALEVEIGIDEQDRIAQIELLELDTNSEHGLGEDLAENKEIFDEKPDKELATPNPNNKNSQEEVVSLAPEVDLVLINIPAGIFLKGIIVDETNDGELSDNDDISYKEIFLDEFWICKYPVTVAQFASFVSSAKYRNKNPGGWMSGLFNHGWKFDLSQHGDHPISDVSWNDAVAFVVWASSITGLEFRLPSEEEWEKAASGIDGRKFPWGNNPPNDTLCNFNENVGNTTSIGEYSPEGDSYFGCSDMAGNICEWTTTIFKEKTSSDTDNIQEEDFVEDNIEAETEYRKIKGGSFLSSPKGVTCADWEYASKNIISDDIGFRVCVSAKSFKR